MLYSRTAQQVTAVTAAAAVLAAGYEGLKYIAYEDPRPGDPILTVCYGSTTDVEVDKVYTLAMMDDEAISAYTDGGMGGAMTAIELASKVKEKYDEKWIIQNVRKALDLAGG